MKHEKETIEVSQKAGMFAATMVILGLLAVSVEPIIVKLGYKVAATTFQLMVLRTVVGGILVLPFTRNYDWKKLKDYSLKSIIPFIFPPFKETGISLKSIRELTVVSVLFIVTNILVFISLHYLTAVTVITITTTTPAFVGLVNQARGRDILNTKFWAGFLLCFIGVLLTIEIYQPGAIAGNALGLLFIFASVVASTIYRTEMDVLTHRYSPISITNHIFLLNGIVAIFCLPFIGEVPKQAYAMGIWLGFAALIANLAFLAAIKILGATRISIFGILQRPLIIIATCFILKENLTWLQIIGIIMVLAGVSLAKVKRVKKAVEGDSKEEETI